MTESRQAMTITRESMSLPEFARDAIETAQRAVQDAYPGPSRAKALVLTKLDEALLWLGEVESGK